MNLSSEPPQGSSVWITAEKTDQLQSLMHQCGWLEPSQSVVGVQRAGEGNMNLTLRVTVQDDDARRHSLIVKQSRPWVEKYPTIEAPVERASFERRFYLAVQDDPFLSQRMPGVIGYQTDQFLLALEDLGPAQDASSLYQPSDHLDTQIAEMIKQLVPWLACLHQMNVSADRQGDLKNTALRELNHQYIFVLPFAEDQTINLDEITDGLQQVAAPWQGHKKIQQVASELGQRYLGKGQSLIHGDFFPGSWLMTDDGLKVIDPEFCHFGLPEFDLGVMIGHLRMTHGTIDSALAVREMYADDRVDWNLVEQFAAIEVLRRLLGLAQLPLSLDLEQKAKRVDAAVETLLS